MPRSLRQYVLHGRSKKGQHQPKPGAIQVNGLEWRPKAPHRTLFSRSPTCSARSSASKSSGNSSSNENSSSSGDDDSDNESESSTSGSSSPSHSSGSSDSDSDKTSSVSHSSSSESDDESSESSGGHRKCLHRHSSHQDASESSLHRRNCLHHHMGKDDCSESTFGNVKCSCRDSRHDSPSESSVSDGKSLRRQSKCLARRLRPCELHLDTWSMEGDAGSFSDTDRTLMPFSNAKSGPESEASDSTIRDSSAASGRKRQSKPRSLTSRLPRHWNERHRTNSSRWRPSRQVYPSYDSMNSSHRGGDDTDAGYDSGEGHDYAAMCRRHGISETRGDGGRSRSGFRRRTRSGLDWNRSRGGHQHRRLDGLSADQHGGDYLMSGAL